TGVLHAGNQHLATGKVQNHAAVAVGTVPLGNADKEGRGQDFPLGLAGRVIGFRADEEVTAEQVLPSSFRDHVDRQVVLWVGTHVYLGDELVAAGQVLFDAIPQQVELFGLERTVDVAPVDGIRRVGLFHDKAVHRGASGTLARCNNQGTVSRQAAFLA